MNIQVYTANVGEHDPPRMEEDGLVVLTDDIMGNKLLSARFYKTCPQILFPDADWTIWIDANVWLHKSPEWFIYKTRTHTHNTGYGLFAHYFRDNAWQEYDAELEFNFEDDVNRLKRTMDRYYNRMVSKHLSQDFIFVRKNTPENTIRNNAWWSEICWGSRRDQLSLEMFYPGPYWSTVDFTKPNEYFTRVDGTFIKSL